MSQIQNQMPPVQEANEAGQNDVPDTDSSLFIEYTPEDALRRDKLILQNNSNHVLIQDEQKLANHWAMQRPSGMVWYTNFILDQQAQIRLIVLQACPMNYEETPGKIALIDLRLMQERAFLAAGPGPQGLSLKTIFESQSHIKFVFDRHTVAGHLLRQFGVKMKHFTSIQLLSNAIAVASCDDEGIHVPNVLNLTDCAIAKMEHFLDVGHEFRCIMAHNALVRFIATQPGEVKLELASYAISSLLVLRKLNEINYSVVPSPMLAAVYQLCAEYTEDLTIPWCTQCDPSLSTPSPFTRDTFERLELPKSMFDDIDEEDEVSCPEIADEVAAATENAPANAQEDAKDGADGTSDSEEESKESSSDSNRKESGDSSSTRTTDATDQAIDQDPAVKTTRRRRRRGRRNKKGNTPYFVPPPIAFDFVCANGTGYMSAFHTMPDPLENASMIVSPDLDRVDDVHGPPDTRKVLPVNPPHKSNLRYHPSMDYTPLTSQATPRAQMAGVPAGASAPAKFCG